MKKMKTLKSDFNSSLKIDKMKKNKNFLPQIIIVIFLLILIIIGVLPGLLKGGGMGLVRYR